MAIGERIHYFRTMRGMTQKQLGQMVGFPEASADIRIAQYESGTRTPKEDLTAKIAEVLEVTPMALLVPDISTSSNMLLTLFGISELYGLTVDEIDGEVCLRIKEDDKHFAGVRSLLSQWLEKERAYQSGEISKGAYDAWKYRSLHFPMPPVTEE